MIERRHEGGPQRGGISVHEWPDLQSAADVRQHRHAELTAATHHEVHHFGRGFLGGADEIPLVLPVFCIDDDDHFATRDRVDGRLNSRKLTCHSFPLWAHRGDPLSADPIATDRSSIDLPTAGLPIIWTTSQGGGAQGRQAGSDHLGARLGPTSSAPRGLRRTRPEAWLPAAYQPSYYSPTGAERARDPSICRNG